jgi:hypothetical protein
MENFDEKNVVKKSSNPFDVFQSKSIILIAAEASILSIFAFQMSKIMVCEGFDLCKHLHIDFRVGFIEAGAPKLNSFCSGVVNFSVLVIDISMQNVQ